METNKDTTPNSPAEAAQHYQTGNAFRKKGDWQHAIEHYNMAIELDPDTPAVEAKEMLMQILEFYHKDSFNP